MKFLLVSPFTGASGSAIRFWNIAQALHDRGHRVVYTDRRAGKRELHSCKGITYYGCPSTGVKPADIIISLFFSTFIFIRHIDCTVFYALKPAPNNCLPALVARLLGKKIILDVDDLDYAYLNEGPARTLFRRLFDLFPRYFHLVTYHTPKLRDYLSTMAHVPDNRLYYLAQGVSPQFLASGTGTNVDDFSQVRLIYVATLGITSDFDDLIPGLKKLFTRFTDASMSVAGDGCRKSEFEQSIKNAGIADHITFSGTIAHSALPGFIAEHRIGINYMRPSPVNECRAILKIREYLACGLEVVCNDVGDVDLFRDFIRVRPSVDAMMNTLAEMLSRPPQRNTAGKAFIDANYRWSTIIGTFERKLQEITTGAAGTRTITGASQG